jgi:NAD(P)-dependent dehydrogenase (short-subunit alcohol dehydrogenase family)
LLQLSRNSFNRVTQAAAKVWAHAGADGIVVVARHIEALEKVSREIQSINPGTKTLLGVADISREEEVKDLFDLVKNKFQRPADVLLNAAGYLEDGQWIGETSAHDWWKTFVCCRRSELRGNI